MSALVWAGGRQVTVEERPRPTAEDGQVLVDVAYCGLCGTDLHICAGEHPRARPGIVLGHELSGRLATDAGGLAAGTKVVVDPLLPCGTCPTCRSGRPHTCATLRLVGIDVPGGAAEQVAVPADRVIPRPTTPTRAASPSPSRWRWPSARCGGPGWPSARRSPWPGPARSAWP